MGCEIYTPQIQLISGEWLSVGIPKDNFREAEEQQSLFFNPKITGFRVLKSDCEKKESVNKACCGR